jgi:hypothetical protein
MATILYVAFTTYFFNINTDEKVNFLFLFSIIAVISIFVGYRDLSIGTDTAQYFSVYTYFRADYYGYQTNYELLYESLIRGAKLLELNFFQFQTLVVFFILLIIFLAIKNLTKDYIFIYLIIIVSPSLFSLLVNIQRQGLAVAFFLLSFSYYINCRIKLAILILLLSALSHKSVVLFVFFIIPVYTLYYYKFGFYKTLIITLVFCLCVSMNIDLIFQAIKSIVPTGLDRFLDVLIAKGETYIDESASKAKVGIGIFSNLVLLFIVIFFTRNMRKLNPVTEKLIILPFTSTVIYLCFSSFEVMTRIASYGNIAIVLLLVLLPNQFRKITYFIIFNMTLAKAIITFN